MDNTALKYVIEALLMSSREPLTLETMQAVFDEWERPTRLQLQEVLVTLANDYETRAIELQCLASGYCFITKPQFAAKITRLLTEKPVKYSNALLETLSIIAYRQPVTRADIEEIRGVSVSTSILKTLLDREWIKLSGHRDVVGKPALYVTTKIFLDYFNLVSLNELPPLEAANHGQ